MVRDYLHLIDEMTGSITMVKSLWLTLQVMGRQKRSLYRMEIGIQPPLSIIFAPLFSPCKCLLTEFLGRLLSQHGLAWREKGKQ